MVVGVTGYHGNRAAWRAEEEREHVLARALILRPNGMDRIALERISQQRAAICRHVKVNRCLTWKFSLPWDLNCFDIIVRFVPLISVPIWSLNMNINAELGSNFKIHVKYSFIFSYEQQKLQCRGFYIVTVAIITSSDYIRFYFSVLCPQKNKSPVLSKTYKY